MTRARALLVLALLVSACAAPPRRAPRSVSPAEGPAAGATDLPPQSDTYGTEPTPNAVGGGDAGEVAAGIVARALRDRGDDPKGDGRLALLASWAAHRAARRSALDAAAVDAVSRRVGFVGPTPWIVTVPSTESGGRPDVDGRLRRFLLDVPRGTALTRYGVAAIGVGDATLVAVALGSVELSLAPLPKRVDVGSTVQLSGVLAERFQHATLSITMPGGGVRSWESSGRAISGPILFPERGTFRVELEAEGRAGPEVIANFPFYVGTDEPAPDAPDVAEPRPTSSLSPEAINVRALALMNGARAQAQLPPLETDEALAAVALGHSKDMVGGGYFAHVSPSGATLDDRLRSAHLEYPVFGENLARAVSVEAAHTSLMESPGHRANILRPEFSRIGIGTVVQGADATHGPVVTMTIDFARPPAPPPEPQAPPSLGRDVSGEVVERIARVRRERGLGTAVADDGLAQAVRAALQVLAQYPTATGLAFGQIRAEMKRRSAHGCGGMVHVRDVAAFEPEGVLLERSVERVGVATREVADGFDVMFLVQTMKGARPLRGCE
jgi:uncharacterized protein YkwD